MITFEEVETLRRAVRPLDCGTHYCRYCDAKSVTGWKHVDSCPYQQSVRDVREAKEIINRLERESAEV